MNDINFKFPIIDATATGKNIKRIREEKNISVKELQNLLGFTTPQAIYKWQWGETLPDISNLLALSKIFNMEIKDILVIENAF